MAKPSRGGCTAVQVVSLGTRGHSFKESGPDHSGTDHSCAVDAQCGDIEQYSNNLKWYNANGVGHETKTKRSPGPSFNESEQLTSTLTKQDLLNE